MQGYGMDRESVIKIVWSYIREHGAVMAVYAGAAVLFYLVAGLYGYGDSMKNMSYALYLAVIFGLLAGIRGCICQIRHLKELLDAGKREGEKGRYLPAARTMAEQCCHDMIREMEEEQRAFLSEYDEKKKDMADYYTMWIHQIKTPIAALRLLLQEETAGRSAREMEELFKIEQYAEMALYYARLDSMSGDLLLRSCDVCGIARQAVKQYFVLFIGSGLSFSMEDFVCHAVTDEKWLSFVIGQILSNALKYTSRGRIRIYVADREGHRTKGEAVYLVMEDTGIGICESDLPRIFERGFTGYNGRLCQKSTGIGLYLCRQIMDRLGHTIEVQSKMGKGTRVCLGFRQE